MFMFEMKKKELKTEYLASLFWFQWFQNSLSFFFLSHNRLFTSKIFQWDEHFLNEDKKTDLD